jgi:hypothetical protein
MSAEGQIEEAALRAGLAQIQAECGGAMLVEWLDQERAVAIAMAWMLDEPDAKTDQRAQALAQTIHTIVQSGLTKEPRRCGGCDRAFRPGGSAPVAFSLLSSGVDDAKHMVGTGYCERCAKNPAEAIRKMALILMGMRKNEEDLMGKKGGGKKGGKGGGKKGGKGDK